MSADSHTHMMNHINALGQEVRELKQNNKGLTILKQEAEQRSFCYEAELKASAQTTENYWKSKFENAQEKIAELQEEVNERVHTEDIAEAFGRDSTDDFDWESEIDSLQKSNKQKTKMIRKFRTEVKKLQEVENRMTDIADANGWDIYPTDEESDEE